MSTLEKTIVLLREMPEQSLESLYDFIISMRIFQGSSAGCAPDAPAGRNKKLSAFGIAHEYANPALWEQEEGAFERAIAEKHAVN